MTFNFYLEKKLKTGAAGPFSLALKYLCFYSLAVSCTSGTICTLINNLCTLATMFYPCTVTQASISMPKLFITQLEFAYTIMMMMLVLYKYIPHMNIMLQTTILFDCCIRVLTM